MSSMIEIFPAIDFIAATVVRTASPPDRASSDDLRAIPSVVLALSVFCAIDADISSIAEVVSSRLAACCEVACDSACDVADTCDEALVSSFASPRTCDNHIQRTQGYVRLLATHLSAHPRFCSTLDAKYIDTLARSAPLHDIGKVGIPDRILLKPGKLTPEEWEIMKTHTILGSEAISHAEKDISSPVEYLTTAKEIARWHHERWDGSGYPDGLAQDKIPLSARLMALADVFDALISKRVYKKAMSFDKVREIIAAERGHQFDPDIADVFLARCEEFESVALSIGIDT